jgi:hypothetical protein
VTILFQGAEMASFTPSDSSVVEVTTADTFDSAFARCSIKLVGSTTYAEGMPSASATDAWIHFEMESDDFSSSTAVTRLSWYDSSANERIRVKYADSSTNQLTVEYWNGSSFTALTAVSVEMGGIRQTIDLHVVCNSGSGTIALYIAGTERLTATVNTTSISNLKKFRFTGGTISSLAVEAWVSQVIMADESTIGWRLSTRYASGAGATTDWTGSYTEIDEIVYNDGDFINSSVADQVELFTNTGPSLSGYTVRSVAVSARAKRGASGPQNIRMALRSAGTTYFSGSDIALGVAYAPVQTIWETDPATASDFLTSAISTVQFGVKSIA